jgi:hypothetical protein
MPCTLAVKPNVDGTLPSAAVRCLARNGLNARAERLGEVDVLVGYLTTHIAIAFVNLAPLLGIVATHAVIVEAIDDEATTIVVIDPAHPPDGRRMIPLALFEISWRLARGQVILVAL